MSPQNARLLRYLQERENVSAYDIIRDTSTLNYTARISELRQAGHDVRCFRDAEGVYRFRLVGQGSLGL